MNKQELAIFASALKTYYPREKLLPNQQAMELWHKQLEDIPYKAAELALNRWVAVNKWSPSIADIRESVLELTGASYKDWGEAWQEVLGSISKYGYIAEREALESLDETTRTAVERLGYRNLCMSDKQEVDRANFRMIYESLVEKQKQEAQIPKALSMLVDDMKIDVQMLTRQRGGTT